MTKTSAGSRTQGSIERLGNCIGDVDRREGLTAKELREEYLVPRRPVVLKGLMDDWPGRTKWTFDFFKEEYGWMESPVCRGFEREGTMPLGEYIDYMREWRKDNDDELPAELPLYADDLFVDTSTPLAKDYGIPDCFEELDWFERFFLKNPMRRGYLLIGPKGSMTKLHIDGQYVHAYVAQFVGKKRWLIVPFDQLKDLFDGYADYIGGWSGYEPPGIEEFIARSGVDYYSTVQEPGEIIIAPSSQFHQVINTEDSIALTNKFVDRSNARKVLWSMFMTRTGLRKSRRLGYLDGADRSD